MTATTKGRNTKRRDGVQYSYPAAASKVLAGTIVVLNASGNAEAATTAIDKIAVGVAAQTVDNSAGSAGDVDVPVRRGTFAFANSASSDEIKLADVGSTCYLVDNQTVAKTGALSGGAGTETRSPAGIVRDVNSDGVWVEF